METIRNYVGMLSVLSWNDITIILFGLALVLMFTYFRSERYQERMVSKRSMKARNKAENETIEQTITEALEAKFKKGELRREAVDHAYKEIKANTRFKSIGIEPTFGKPWYEPIKTTAEAVKKGSKRRLENMGVHINAALHSMKQRKEVPTKNTKSLKSFRKQTV